ncbi:MAG: capsid protein [Gemycircularvirus mouti1]|uniref:capsid protein n=1 Tax=Genomoviridae sp. TaxID=2202565 RepID=UPI002481F9E8|nr:MAG: capsid protein [Genomoviridae sp.]QCW23676.1 MAG: capsid protein [Genomoviridae sp.]
MAYARSRSYKSRGRRPIRTSRKGGVRKPSRRSYAGKKRTYRKKTSSKMILNMTSRKKKDTMISYTNVTASTPQGGTTYANTGAVMPATQQYIFLWIPTARDLTRDVGGSRGLISDEATRTAHTCFMRGLKENIEITTNDGLPWQWRRICFTFKAGTLIGSSTGIGMQVAIQTSSGWTRVVNTLYGNPAVGGLQSALFRGAAGVDWSNIMTAPTDTTNFSIKYDKTVSISSGNEDGCIRNYRRWHAMNKNLVYNDDEQGGSETQQSYSTGSKPGMGDYYIVDIFQPRTGGTASSVLRFEPTATLYWHEK